MALVIYIFVVCLIISWVFFFFNLQKKKWEKKKEILLFSRIYCMTNEEDHLRGKVKKNKIGTYPTVTSNILLPTELETAISPNPFLATITDVIRSGMEVPAAKNVKPITCHV